MQDIIMQIVVNAGSTTLYGLSETGNVYTSTLNGAEWKLLLESPDRENKKLT